MAELAQSDYLRARASYLLGHLIYTRKGDGAEDNKTKKIRLEEADVHYSRFLKAVASLKDPDSFDGEPVDEQWYWDG